MPRRVFLFLFFAFLSFAPARAEAAITLCNHTSFVLYAATAYAEEFDIVSTGWTRLRPGACATKQQSVKPDAYFVYARSARAHSGPLRAWGGDGGEALSVCAQTDAFSFRTRVSENRCANADAYRLPFKTVAAKNGDAVMRFYEKRRFEALKDAERAGLQRLLSETGSKLGADSPPGPETDAAEAAFRVRAKLASTATRGDVIDALEAEARKSSQAEGYAVCNQTSEPIFVASGANENGKFVARGWWKVGPSLCSRLVTQPLNTDRFFIRAEKTNGAAVLQGAEKFCVTDIEFEIIGRENCPGRGLREAGFAVSDVKGKRGYTARVGPPNSAR